MKMDWKEKLAELQELLTKRRDARVEPIAADVSETPYYRERSIAYASAQMVVLLVLAVYLAVSFMTGSANFSVANLSLLMSDLGSAVVLPESGGSETLTYIADDQNQYVDYRGGVAVLGRNRLSVFTATGRENYTVSLNYHTPRLLSSGKYLVAYDLGGNRFSVFNALTRLYDETTDTPIRGMAVSDAGYLCLITDDSTYASAITLYDRDFDIVSRYHLKEHTAAVAIAKDGEQLAIASVSSVNGMMTTSVMLSVPGAQEALTTAVLADAYPLSLIYTKDSLLLLCTDAVYALDREGEIIGEYHFESEKLLGMSLHTSGAVLQLRTQGHAIHTQLIVLDEDAAVRSTYTTEQMLRDAVLDAEGTLYLLTDGELLAYAPKEDAPYASVALMSVYEQLLPMGNGELFLCGRARAVCIRPRGTK